jgi:hypothetical protein
MPILDEINKSLLTDLLGLSEYLFFTKKQKPADYQVMV